MTTAANLAALDIEADRLRAEGAPGSAFEALSRRGWTPRSAREGNGLDPCPSDCGVCYPTPLIRARLRRKGKA